MADQQQIDHYDFINAPQFVDFDDLASHDDPQADKFFETHREEDDFMIPLDINNISPTVQLLYGDDNNENEHYSNEANKAAMAAGLEDVKIEYYASPQQQKNTQSPLSVPNSMKKDKRSVTSVGSSVYGTPLGGNSGCSSGTSFYTPTGNEDKENLTPTNPSSGKKTVKGGSAKKSNGKLEAYGIKNNSNDQHERSILSERALKEPAANKVSTDMGSLYARLEELEIVSSDEEEFWNDKSMNKDGNSSVAKSHAECITDSKGASPNSKYSPFKGNRGLEASPKEADEDEMKDEEQETSINHNDETLVIQHTSLEDPKTLHNQGPPISPILRSDSDDENEQNNSVPMELRTPVRNILSKLDAELQLDGEMQETPGNENDDPRYSIVVAPSVGKQIHWNVEGQGPSPVSQVQVGCSSGAAASSEGRPLNVSYKVHQGAYDYYDYDSDGEDGDVYSADIYAVPMSLPGSKRRSSSVGDLTSALLFEPKTREFNTYGYNPRVGITIPKTPDCPRSSSEKDTQQQYRPGPSKMEAFSSNKNSCYFEVEPPAPPVKNMRRASSCSDLNKILAKKPMSTKKPKAVQKKPLTIPRTPDTVKRGRKENANRGNISTSSSTCNESRYQVGGKKTGPSVADRLAAAKSRQPMKGNHYVSMAEAMAKFQKNTPDRFRSLPRGQTVPEKRAASCDARKRGQPSPAISPSSSRSRADSFSNKTSNLPRVGRTVNNGPTLPKKVELKTTIPMPFNFGSTHKPRSAPVKEDAVDFKFKARPAPTKAHENIAKLKPQVKVTQPLSPRFASDARLKERLERQQKRNQTTKEPESKPVKSNNLQKATRIPTTAASSSRIHVDEHKTTVAQPFSTSFEARQKEILRKKEETIKQKLEEENKKITFHANPVPNYSGMKLPKKKPVEATSVEPFRLESDMRGAAYQEAFKRRLEEEEQYNREQALFHAQPADVIHRAPFEPERPARHIEVVDLHLATERRAVEREQFDEHLREKEREEEERRKKEQEELEELQRQEDIEKRRQLVHKAQPFKAPKPFQLKSSARPLTVPHSPAFSALPSQRRVRQPSPAPQ